MLDCIARFLANSKLAPPSMTHHVTNPRKLVLMRRCEILISSTAWSALLFLICIVKNLLRIGGLFLEGPETFRAYFGWHNSDLFVSSKPKRLEARNFAFYFYFSSLYNIWKDQLCRISRTYFYEWLFGPEKFSGLSRNGPQILYQNLVLLFCYVCSLLT